MQVTSLLSQHEHGPDCGCGHDHEHSVVHLWQAVLGVVCVLNAFIVDWFFDAGTTARQRQRHDRRHHPDLSHRRHRRQGFAASAA